MNVEKKHVGMIETTRLMKASLDDDQNQSLRG